MFLEFIRFLFQSNILFNLSMVWSSWRNVVSVSSVFKYVVQSAKSDHRRCMTVIIAGLLSIFCNMRCQNTHVQSDLVPREYVQCKGHGSVLYVSGEMLYVHFPHQTARDNVMITPPLRQNKVGTSFRRNDDIVIASCVHWGRGGEDRNPVMSCCEWWQPCKLTIAAQFGHTMTFFQGTSHGVVW